LLTTIPCMMMRGGTSKGPFFLASDLPSDPAQRDQVLLSVMGSPDIRQIDGMGGGSSLTSKVVIVSRSSRPGIDLDYLFAQVSVEKNTVDTTPNCGNMLSGVGPFAIDRGLIEATDPVTAIRVFNINTSKVIELVVQTPGRQVTYDGTAQVDGVPGLGAPIALNFLNAAGAKTGKLLPTGNAVDLIDGIEVSCVDFSTPVVFIAARDVGKTGHETKQQLDADAGLLARLERIRRQAGLLMGMGDVAGKVLPKLVLLSTPRYGGSITSRYFVPLNCHAAHAVTGALCVAAACVIPGTVASALVQSEQGSERTITIEHPAGKLETRVQIEDQPNTSIPSIERAGIIRTARPLLSGVVYIPDSVWNKKAA
jgi:4-oxalomesaconate tautomerase